MTDINFDNSFNLSNGHFMTQGWLGPFALLTNIKVNELTNCYLQNKSRFISPIDLRSLTMDQKLPLPWFKSVHSILPDFLEIVTHSSIIDKVKMLLGDNIILWGTSITTRKPGQKHRWHIDVEHSRWKGVTVFIGLTGTSKDSSLKIIPKSHLFNRKPEGDLNNDNSILKQSASFIASPEIKTIPVCEGEFFIFDGLLWHGSENLTNNTRYSIIAQYTTPENEVFVPLNYDDPITWSTMKPPCVLVSGKDSFNLNYLI